jgi:hypothetical protein
MYGRQGPDTWTEFPDTVGAGGVTELALVPLADGGDGRLALVWTEGGGDTELYHALFASDGTRIKERTLIEPAPGGTHEDLWLRQTGVDEIVVTELIGGDNPRVEETVLDLTSPPPSPPSFLEQPVDSQGVP